jgi:RNA polymerase sigma-54 factor
LLAKGEMTIIAKKCHVKKPELSRMVSNLRQLDPKITGRFESAASQVRPPEIIVRPASAADDNAIEGWYVELNDETLPKVLLLDRYWEELASHKMTDKDRKYLSGNYQSGQWLVKTLNQRAVTMLRVAREIVRQQTAFLEDGVQYLKPMILADIAEELDLHESTISRVTAGKLIETPRGMFELKFFFTSGLNRSDGGGEHSAAAVRARIEKLVMQETTPVAKGVKPKILSDDALAKALQADGVDIARRTVAKYREAMGIPSSAQRKRTARLTS